MSQPYPLVNDVTMLFFSALIYISCLVWCCLVKVVGGLADVCTDAVPLVLGSFAWEDTSNSFECRDDYNVEAGSFSYTPQAASVGNTGTALLREERNWQVRHTCTSTSSLAVVSRSHYLMRSQEGSESQGSVPREHSLAVAASFAESQVSSITHIDETLGNVEAAPAAEASQGAENYGSAIQVDALYFESMELDDLPLVDPMVIDPWWWQGVVTFEYTPEMMNIDPQVEGGLGGADLDQPAQVMEDFEMQENSDVVEFEDVLMEDAFIEAEPVVQENMEIEVHLGDGVEPGSDLADPILEQAPVPEGDSSVVSSAPEATEEGDVVNRGCSASLPTLPSSEVLNEDNSVLSQAPVQDQDTSEDHSGSAGPSRGIGQHPAGCKCAICAAFRDLEKERALEEEEEEEEEDDEEEEEDDEQEWAREQARALMNRTCG